jgi:hypothetical protein
MPGSPFHLKIRIGDNEVEIGGTKEEVMATLADLDAIVDKVSLAFKEKASTGKVKQKKNGDVEYPKITHTTQCSEAIVTLLELEWGKTPRTIGELREAMEANAIFFPKSTISGVLSWLIKKGRLRRWKDKKRGYLYVINEKKES